MQQPFEAILPRGLKSQDAAAYCGVGRTKFLALVNEGVLPQGIKISPGRVIWLRDQLDRRLDKLQQQAEDASCETATAA